MRLIFALVVLFAAIVGLTNAVAGPECGSKAATVAATESKSACAATCSGKVQTVAQTVAQTNNATCTAAKKASCASTCSGKAQTVAAKGSCASSCSGKAKTVNVQTVSNKSSCASTCAGKAQTVANKPSCSSTCASKAQVAKHTCTKTCGGTVQTVANTNKAAQCSGHTAGAPAVAKANCAATGSNSATNVAPGMMFVVATETTGCENNAAKLAKQHDAKITYVVDGTAYKCKSSASQAHLAQLEGMLTNYTKVAYKVGDEVRCCEKMAMELAKQTKGKMTYWVAGTEYNCPVTAKLAAQMSSAAVSAVQVYYKVGDKAYRCNAEAGKHACASSPMRYVVLGNETNCETTAKVMAARERLNAAAKMAQQIAIMKQNEVKKAPAAAMAS